MKRVGAWVTSAGLLALGIWMLMGSVAFLRPATNPIGDAAPDFQTDVILGTLVAVGILILSELAARRWSAPAGGWRWGWFLIGGEFLILGTPLLLEAALEDSTPLAERTRAFRLAIGGLWVALGIAACAVPAARRREKAPV